MNKANPYATTQQKTISTSNQQQKTPNTKYQTPNKINP